MAALHAELVQQFLHISVIQWKAVVEPNCVLNDCHLEHGGGTVSGRSPTLIPSRPGQGNTTFAWMQSQFPSASRG